MDTIARRILLVEDDAGIAAPLTSALRGVGHAVDHVSTATEALHAADRTNYHLVVLDLGLPDRDGLEVCRELRAASGVPILVLTARASEADVVVGLDAGADDYVAKPFRLAELTARLRALLRRTAADAPDPVDEVIAVGGLRLDRGARRVHLDGVELDLTPTEYDLLVALVGRAGRVATREDLVKEVWDTDWVGTSRTLDMHVSALRRKFGDDPSSPRYLTTVRGVGFRFEAHEDTPDDASPSGA